MRRAGNRGSGAARRNWSSERRVDLLIAVAIVCLGAALRLYRATEFVSWDEPAWVYRCAKFLLGLTRGDLGATLQTGHPGVITMWTGALSLAWHRWVTGAISSQQLAAVDGMAEFLVHDAASLRLLGQMLPFAKQGLLVFHALCGAVVYLLLCDLSDRPTALTAAILLLFDPWTLGLSRLMHIDAAVSELVLTALLAAIRLRRTGKGGLLCGVALGMAVLAKTYGGLASIAVTIIVLWPRDGSPAIAVPGIAGRPGIAVPGSAGHLPGTRSAEHLPGSGNAIPGSAGHLPGTRSAERPGSAVSGSAGHLPGSGNANPGSAELQLSTAATSAPLCASTLLTRLTAIARVAAVALATVIILWPALWTQPGSVITSLLGTSIEYATDAGDATASFFLGKTVSDPGVLFYPVALWWRMTPLVLIGLASGLIVWLVRVLGRADERGERVHRWLVLFALLFTLLMSLLDKKFDRYVLVVHLLLIVISSSGLMAAGRWLISRARAGYAWLATALVISLAMLQVALVLVPLYPSHALAYYSPLSGGVARAVDVLPVGWGEGIEQATRWLAVLPEAEGLTVATWAVAGVAPFAPCEVVAPTAEALARADYVLRYVTDRQGEGSDPPEETGLELAEVFQVSGLDYVWLYHNGYAQELVECLTSEDGEPAAIVASAPSRLADLTSVNLPIYTLEGDTERQIAGELTAIAESGVARVYCVVFEGDPQRMELIRRQLAQSGYLLWQEPFALGSVSSYALADNARFGTITTARFGPVRYGAPYALSLDRVGLASAHVAHRREIGLGLDWQAISPVSDDLHVSLRLVDGLGRVWASRDTPLVDGTGLCTSAWAPDSVHSVRLGLTVPAATAPGTYWLAVEVYALGAQSALPRFDGKGAPLTTPALVGQVTVGPDRWPTAGDELLVPNAADVELADGITLLGYGLSPAEATTGETVDLDLYWRCVQPMEESYELRVQLEAGGDTQSWRVAPVPGYRTDRWLAGEVIRYPHQLRIDSGLTTGHYALFVSLADERGEWDGPRVSLATVRVTRLDRLYDAPAMKNSQVVTFGETIQLAGYDLAVGDSGEVDVTLYWLALALPGHDYSVFVHLMDASGQILDQVDSPPQGGARPSSGWVAGEYIVDTYALSAPELSAGFVPRLAIGLYDPATGVRLVAVDAQGSPVPDGRLILGN